MSEHIHIERILILDDDADFRKLLLTYLGKLFDGIAIEEYDPVARGVPGEGFDWSRYDVLILDYYLCIHNVTGLDILAANRKNEFFPATIMLTGAGNEEIAVRAIKAGIYDYLRKEKLDKDELRRSILDAFEKHKSERRRLSELTHQSRAFNKALFYQQLEETSTANAATGRVLLVIELNDHETVEERLGVILRDNVVRHIARQSYEVFDLGDCNPQITRLSDVSVALLIDDPGSSKTLAFNLKGLCEHLQKRPYRFDDRKFRFTVSMGAVVLPKADRNAEILIRQAREACATAARGQGNSFSIYAPPTGEAEMPDAGPALAQESAQSAPMSDDGGGGEPEMEPVPEATVPKIEKEASVSVEAPGAEPGESELPAPQFDIPEPEEPVAAAVEKTEPEPVQVAPAETAETVEPPAPQSMPAPAPRSADKAPVAASATTTKEPAPQKSPAQAQTDEIRLDPAALTMAALRIKRAFDDKRIVLTFQPVMPLFNTETADAGEMYLVGLQMIDTNGKIVEEHEVHAAADSPAFRQFIDRWLLRESIGRIVNSSEQKNTLMLRISGASLADQGLFNWLRRLLSGLDERRPGSSIALEVSAEDFKALGRKASALVSYFSKTHGFRFVLAEISDTAQIESVCSGIKPNLVRVSREQFGELQGGTGGPGPLLQSLKAKEIRTIIDDVQDANGLTSAIAAGADYAMGTFIGEATSQIDDTTNVELFEIT